MKNDIASNSIAVAARAPSFHKMSKLWALLTVALGLTVVVAAEDYSPPVSCERHGGAFSNAF